MIEAHKIIDSARQREIDPVLKQAGFKRTSRVFRRWVDENCQVLDLQLSRWNTSPNAQFTINLGLYCPAFNKALDIPLKPNPYSMHCTTRERIGFLLPEKRDTWWEVNPKTKATDLAAQLTPAVGAAMRWFEDMKSTRDAATYLEKTGYFYLAAAAYLGVADLASAKLCVRRAIDLGRITADGVAWARSRKLIE